MSSNYNNMSNLNPVRHGSMFERPMTPPIFALYHHHYVDGIPILHAVGSSPPPATNSGSMFERPMTPPIFALQVYHHHYVDGIPILHAVGSSPPPATNPNPNPLVVDGGLVLDDIHLHHLYSRPVADEQRASAGLSEETIRKRLKTTRLKISSGDDADVVGEETCVICQAEYGEDEIIVGILDCGHRYHPECIREWLLRQNSCPICKRKAIS